MVSPSPRLAGLLAALALLLGPGPAAAIGEAPPGSGGTSGGLLGTGLSAPEGPPPPGDLALPTPDTPPPDRLAPRQAPLVYTPDAPPVDPRTGLPAAADRDALFDLPDEGFMHVYAAARVLDADTLTTRIEALPGGANPAPGTPKGRALAALARVLDAHRYVVRDGPDALRGLYTFPWLHAERIVAARETLLLRGRLLHRALVDLHLATADALFPG